ncbi:unnamed protein product [Callosobruchus maculatus]|nr:unnamed protein product [Callosobruchus maculatus]
MSLSENGEPAPSPGYQGRTGPYYGGVEHPPADHSPYYHWTQGGHQHHRQCSSTAVLGHPTNQHPYYDPGGHLQEPRRFAEAGNSKPAHPHGHGHSTIKDLAPSILGDDKSKDDGELWNTVEAQTAFLGPNLWDKTYETDLKRKRCLDGQPGHAAWGLVGPPPWHPAGAQKGTQSQSRGLHEPRHHEPALTRRLHAINGFELS